MGSLSDTELVEVYEWMKLTRLLDERIVSLWKQGRGVGGTFSERGHEAISVGAGFALETDDVVAPMHRDLGCYLLRGMTPRRILANQLGRDTGVTRGRDANLHGMGDLSLGVIGFVSHLPQSMSPALGAALAFSYRDEPRVAMSFVGDGSSSAGLFHETLNLAAVQRAPYVVVVENNQYAYSTPLYQQMAVADVAERGAAHGVPSEIVDGNDVEAVYAAVSAAVARARAGGGPSLIECKTMRMLGHAIHDGAEYVPAELLAEWEARDPVAFAERLLIERDILSKDEVAGIADKCALIVDDAVEFAEGSDWPDADRVEDGVYASPRVTDRDSAPPGAASGEREMTYIEAISDALHVEMHRDGDVLVLGEDVAGTFGGAFKVTQGFEEEFGVRRVMNMPMTENAFVGAATGMSFMGLRPVVEVQFADFITSAFDAIVQFAATNHYRWGGAVPWVIRAPADGGISSGPFHSQNPEAWFVHTPGLKVVAPATPSDAKGLLLAAVRDDNPVIYLESKPLYRSLREPVPLGSEAAVIGEARIARAGSDVSVITYGAMVHEALAAAGTAAEAGVDVEVVDLRTLKPLDADAVLESAARTGRVLVVHSANRMVGMGAEVAALVADEAFDHLDAPVKRLGGLDVPVPFSPPLEKAYRPDRADIADAISALAAW